MASALAASPALGLQQLSSPQAPLRPARASARLVHRPRDAHSPAALHQRRHRAAIVAAAAAATGWPGVSARRHVLPDGMGLEMLRMEPTTPSTRPPLLFVHGSYHGAWCWAERWMPYFAAAGYDCWAVSLRGQGGSDRAPPGGPQLKVSGDLDSLAADLAHVVAHSMPAPPVLVAHSFGALLAEKYLADGGGASGGAARPALAGVACVCGVPPSGNKAIVMRVVKRSLLDAWKITWAFVGKSFAKSEEEARYTFFSPDLPLPDLQRYQRQLAACSPVRLLDLGALNRVLPLPPLPAAAKRVPAFVGGGTTDLVVDWQAVQETAEWFGVEPQRWEDVAHDCMLDTRWETAAASLRSWLDRL